MEYYFGWDGTLRQQYKKSTELQDKIVSDDMTEKWLKELLKPVSTPKIKNLCLPLVKEAIFSICFKSKVDENDDEPIRFPKKPKTGKEHKH